MERLLHHDGQRVTARDLRDMRARDATLRAWHVGTLHDTWGIALGFDVTLAESRRSLRVTPGYAVDAKGRDLVLTETRELAVPAGRTGLLILVARDDTDDAFRERMSAVPVCLDGARALREAPAFAWVRAEDLAAGDDVPLVAAVVSAGVVQGDPILRVRRYARAMARAHIGSGATLPGRTGWRDWNARPNYLLGIQATVDTSAAAFTQTPHYFAALLGPSDRVLADLGFIENPTDAAFTFSVPGARPPFGLAPDARTAEQAGWTIAWIGIEPAGGCPPQFRALLEAHA